MVTELNIIDVNSNIFSDTRYIVPLYQRGYAWEEKHIVQLVEDIMDIQNGSHYYIGSLIVYRRADAYEVIDGQQRLTTLYLLLRYLDIVRDEDLRNLSFDCRKKSNYTLGVISELSSGNPSKEIIESNIQQELLQGYSIIESKLSEIDIESLKDKLKKTVLYRIEVPPHTDLNRYFEIMNTRGEQLEQSDVLKARLMEALKDDRQWQSIFAAIWDACRDMDGYVQMNFSKDMRETIFGSKWECMPSAKIKDFIQGGFSDSRSDDDHEYSIKEIIDENIQIEGYSAPEDNLLKSRFESIIDFPYFLLHTLRVFIHHYNISSDSDIIDRQLDDKKLADAFQRVLDNGCLKDKQIDRKWFSKRFVICLLRTRYLFDKYIIKREYAGEAAQDGKWSLTEMSASGQGGNKRAMYRMSNVAKFGQHDKNKYNEEIKMIQAAMRVSYTSPKVMHWITESLIWLTDWADGKVEWDFLSKVDDIAKKPVVEFLKDEKNFHQGVSTHHIVLNYLDFLLWKDYKKNNKEVNFDFEFRNSVEHWYPRNPSKGSFPTWEEEGAEGVDRFGNLCLIQRNVNSQFSNLHPHAKKTSYPEMIAKGSLKLRLMSEMTEDSMQWRKEKCRDHENDMILMLKKACGVD